MPDADGTTDRKAEEGQGEDLRQVPGHGGGDIAKGAAKAVISAVPIVGGPIAELIDLVFSPVIVRRRERWLEDLAAAVEQLRERQRDFDLASLARDEAAMTVALTATAAAMRTHQAEKLEALRNAVLNSALHVEPDEHVQLMFTQLVDEFTALHLRMLALFDDPGRWFQTHGVPRPNQSGSRTILVEAALPEFRGQKEVYTLAAWDLNTRGLMNGAISGMLTDQGMWQSLTTELGRRFLRFIASPSAT